MPIEAHVDADVASALVQGAEAAYARSLAAGGGAGRRAASRKRPRREGAMRIDVAVQLEKRATQPRLVTIL